MSEIQFRRWRKSTKSDGGQDCVEVADAVDASAVRVRDTKDRDGGTLAFAGPQWAAFVDHAKSGGFVA